MTHPFRHPVRWLLLCSLGGLAISALATGCSSKGYSADCPSLVLYDVNDASTFTKEAQQARLASEQAGCSTPIGHATSGTGGSPPVDAGGG